MVPAYRVLSSGDGLALFTVRVARRRGRWGGVRPGRAQLDHADGVGGGPRRCTTDERFARSYLYRADLDLARGLETRDARRRPSASRRIGGLR